MSEYDHTPSRGLIVGPPDAVSEPPLTPRRPTLAAISKDDGSERPSGEPDLSFLDRPARRPFNLPRRHAEAPHHAESDATQSDDRTLTVGKDITLSGEIATCDTLIVEGRIEATLPGGRLLEVSDTGVFKGSAEVGVAKISGVFDGDLVVRGHLEVLSTGCVSGKIRYARLQVAAGGELNGDIAASAAPLESGPPAMLN